MAIPTRFLVISDTHGDPLRHAKLTEVVDVVIHCGDLTEESKLSEFKTSIELLNAIDAPLKLIIAGNHDWTWDIPMFQKKLAEHDPPLEDELVQKEYGRFGEARALFDNAAGIVFLNEGMHRFELSNDASLNVYASPYTPSVNDWGFNYPPTEEHTWDIAGNVDVAITHCPPKGVLDRVAGSGSVGSPGLFAAIARARPLLHCFGHIHTGWGAKRVGWHVEAEIGDQALTHMTAIDGDTTVAIQNLAKLKANVKSEGDECTQSLRSKGFCATEMPAELAGKATLCVNAAIEGPDDASQQVPWIVETWLARTSVPQKETLGSNKRKNDFTESVSGKRSCMIE
nr:hypothetical protein B0A51_11162 [Rachicladosporium sp. CCFEE 5018]